MDTYVVGDTIVIEVPLLDANGVVIADAETGDFSSTIRHTAVTGTRTDAALSTWTYDGHGIYLAEITPAAEGRYSGLITFAGPPVQPFAFACRVLTATQADPAAALATTVAQVDTLAGRLTSGRAEKLDRIGSDSVTVRSATAASALIELRQGADYTTSVDMALEWDVTTDTDLSPIGTVVTLVISSRSLQGSAAISVVCAVANPSAATKTITAELTDAETARLRTSEFTRYQVDAQIGTDTVPLVEGRVKVLPALA